MAESNFKRLERKLSHRKDVYNPAGLAAHIGDEKIGAHAMAKRAAASRKEHERKRRDAKLHSRKRH